jgi:hypothetical protein
MRRLLLMLIPALMMAQRSALPPQEAFDRDLKRNRLGTWLVLEDDGAAWGATFRTALDDDALVLLNLPVRVVSGGKKPDVLAVTLRERYSWAKGAHWALVDARGQVLIERAAQPTVAGLVSAVEQSGVKSRTQELEAFLKQNPDHLEAQCALIRELATIASRRTMKALGPPPTKPADAPEAVEPPKQLEPEDDQKLWSPVAQRLDQLFKGPWRESGMDSYFAISASGAEHSPSMVALLTRYRGEMEEALRHRPNAVEPWLLWLAASRKCGGWPLGPLLQSLQPLPGTPPGEWPPLAALNAATKDLKERQDWAGIREILEPRWVDMKTGDNRPPGGFVWNWVLSPLLEALVSLGDVGAADQLLNEALTLEGGASLPGQARDLATRLNRPDLAARWGALPAKGR